MKIITLASGSKGNASYIEVGNTRFLIDIGITYRHLLESLEKIGKSIDDIDALFITHTHSDHIKGLKVFVKHNNVPVYIKEEMYKELKEILPKEKIELYSDKMHLKDVTIDLVHTSHDAPGAVGFLINNSLVYITDTGYINKKYYDLLSNREIYYIESNHDEQMLLTGPYPHYLKQRILSDKGHLSNGATASYLEKFIGSNTKYIILAHISETNNTKELALETTKEALANTIYSPKIIVASQEELGEVVEV
ncbi:MBL fold metallo-hydrolase [bacterium]|nr:MBL fold metallo-hydrolase [bacterium]